MAFVVTNDGSSQHGLFRNVGSAFPSSFVTVIWQMWFTVDRVNQFQTYATAGPNVFNITNNYWVCFDGSGGVSHAMAIGSDGDDTYGPDTPTVGRWYQMAFRRRQISGLTHEQLFYYDLPNTSRVISRPDTNGNNFGSTTDLAFGYAPWTGGEGTTGKFRSIKVFTTDLAVADIVAEAPYANLVNQDLSIYLWGRYSCDDNGTDLSGNGRHLSIQTNGSFDGDPAPTSSDTTPPSVPTGVQIVG